MKYDQQNPLLIKKYSFFIFNFLKFSNLFIFIFFFTFYRFRFKEILKHQRKYLIIFILYLKICNLILYVKNNWNIFLLKEIRNFFADDFKILKNIYLLKKIVLIINLYFYCKNVYLKFIWCNFFIFLKKYS